MRGGPCLLSCGLSQCVCIVFICGGKLSLLTVWCLCVFSFCVSLCCLCVRLFFSVSVCVCVCSVVVSVWCLCVVLFFSVSVCVCVCICKGVCVCGVCSSCMLNINVFLAARITALWHRKPHLSAGRAVSPTILHQRERERERERGLEL